MTLTPLSQPRFPAGELLMTVGVAVLVQSGQLNAAQYLRRHLSGDWGDLNENARRANDSALRSGDSRRLFSSYHISPDLTIWIITEWDRSATTVLLPSEY